MSFPLAVVICLSAIQLCMGDTTMEDVTEVITTKKVPFLGGWNNASTDSADVQEATQYAVKMFNSNSKGSNMFKLVSITDAQSQVTNMIHFKIVAVLRKTTCPKIPNPERDHCGLTKKHRKCQFEVIFDPRNNKYELVKQSCRKILKENEN